MGNFYRSIRLTGFLVCLVLIWPAEFCEAAEVVHQPVNRLTSLVKSRRQKSTRARRTRRKRSRVRRNTATAPQPSFDRVLSENRVLLNEANDAELAAAKIEENTMRAHVKFLADDLLEGRG